MYAELANKVLDLARAAKSSGGALERFRAVYAGEQEQNASLERPFVIITLDDPAVEEAWTAAKDVRTGRLTMRLDAVMRAPRNVKDYPWGKPGDADSFGALEALEVLGDFVDANRNAILSASPKAVDVTVTGRINRGIGDDTWIAGLTLTISNRFRSGTRRP